MRRQINVVVGFNQDWPNQAKCVKSKFVYFTGGLRGALLMAEGSGVQNRGVPSEGLHSAVLTTLTSLAGEKQ